MKKRLIALLLLLILAAVGIIFLRTSEPKNIKNDINSLSEGSFKLVYQKSSDSFKKKMDEATFKRLLEKEKLRLESIQSEKDNGNWHVQLGAQLVMIYAEEGGVFRLSQIERTFADGRVEETAEIVAVENSKLAGMSLVGAMLSRESLSENPNIDGQYIQSLNVYVQSQLEGYYNFNAQAVLGEAVKVDETHYEIQYDLEDHLGHKHEGAIKLLFNINDPKRALGIKIEGLCHMEDVLPNDKKDALLKLCQKDNPKLKGSEFQYIKTVIDSDILYAKVTFKSKNHAKLVALDYRIEPDGKFESLAVSKVLVPVPFVELKPLETKSTMIDEKEGESWYKTVADEFNGIYLDHYYRIKEGKPYEVMVRVRNAKHKVIDEVKVPFLYKDYILI